MGEEFKKIKDLLEVYYYLQEIKTQTVFETELIRDFTEKVRDALLDMLREYKKEELQP